MSKKTKTPKAKGKKEVTKKSAELDERELDQVSGGSIVHAVSHEIVSPRDVSTGLVRGK
jgi:hypothetical protein